MKPEIQQAIILALTEKLPEIPVHNDAIVLHQDLRWIDELTEKMDKTSIDRLTSYCGAKGLRDLVRSEVHLRLHANYDYDTKDNPVPLGRYPEFRNILAVSREIVAKLTDIPHFYRVTVGLPKAFSIPLIPYVRSTPLSATTSIFLADDLPEDFPLVTGNPRLDRYVFNSWYDGKPVEDEISKERIYLSKVMRGYGGDEGSQILFRQLEDDLRAFYGAAMALGMVSIDYKHSDTVKRPHMILHEEGPPRKLVVTEPIEDELWNNNFRLSTLQWVDSKPDENRIISARNAVSSISRIYGEDLTARRIYTACIWFLKATLSVRPLDALLESTIAIEVLLGDEKESEGIGLTKLLRNRCAYMLGKDQDERDSILKTFTDFYKLRSAIVHSGRHRASDSERTVVASARKLCGRVIAHELGGAAV